MINLIEEKINRGHTPDNPVIKGRSVFNGRVQQGLYTQKRKLHLPPRALYGCVQSALLWYELYVNTLKDLGFILNLYDLCVANCMIEGKQCTIAWYVDDNKISHIHPKVIDRIINEIKKKFGKMSQIRNNEHEFLGMNITFKNKKVTIEMKKHIMRLLYCFPA